MTHQTDLSNAAKEGNHSEVARLLTGLTAKEVEYSGALREAATNGHTQCVQLLYSSNLI